MALLLDNAGAAEPFAEILQLPDDEIGAKLDIVGAAAAPPGTQGATWVDLTHRVTTRWSACPIPESTGPAHFLLGMSTELVVD